MDGRDKPGHDGGRGGRGGRARRPLLPTLLAALASLISVTATAQTPDTTKTILALPAVQWNDMGVSWHYAAQQTPRDLARAMGGLIFGLKTDDVSQRLPKLGTDLRWSNLPVAREFPEEVRFVRMPMQAAGSLRPPGAACFGELSNLVLLFRDNALMRVSWRFLPDQACPDVHNAAESLYATFVPLAATLAVSTHYRTGSAEVVDVTDPVAGKLIAQRWQARQ